MRHLLLVLPALLLAPTTACNFLEFDDLKDDVAVISLDRPSEKTTDFGIALQRGKRESAAGGSVIILGNNRIAFTRYDIEADGAMERTVSVDFQTQLGSPQQFQPSSLLIADSESDTVALVTPTLQAGESAIYENPGGATFTATNLASTSSLFGATYVKAPTSRIVVVGGNAAEMSFLARLPVPPETGAQKCSIVDGAGLPVQVRAIAGQYVSDATLAQQDLVVLASDGRILVYPGAVASCASSSTVQPLAGKAVGQLDLGFVPGAGTRLLPLGDRHLVLAAIQEGTSVGSVIQVIAVEDATLAPHVVGDPKIDDNLRSVSLLETVSGTGFIAAGYPETTVASEEAAGEVVIFDVTTAGVGNAVARVSRASPDGGDRLGRAVALFEFNGEPLLAAGGNEHGYIFFSAGAFYSDRRTGRTGQ